MSEVPFESRNKYGVFDDDFDELAAQLNGAAAGSIKPRNSLHPERDDREVDASFLLSLRSSNSKYGG